MILKEAITNGVSGRGGKLRHQETHPNASLMSEGPHREPSVAWQESSSLQLFRQSVNCVLHSSWPLPETGSQIVKSSSP